MENDEAHSVVLCGPLSSCCRTGRLHLQSAILSHTFTFLPPPYAQSDPLISPPCPSRPCGPMPSPMLPLAWSQQQKVKEQDRVCRSAFYGVPEDLTMETGESKPTRVCLSCLARAKTWSKVWCTSHGRRAGDDGTRHARSEELHFG